MEKTFQKIDDTTALMIEVVEEENIKTTIEKKITLSELENLLSELQQSKKMYEDQKAGIQIEYEQSLAKFDKQILDEDLAVADVQNSIESLKALGIVKVEEIK